MECSYACAFSRSKKPLKFVGPLIMYKVGLPVIASPPLKIIDFHHVKMCTIRFAVISAVCVYDALTLKKRYNTNYNQTLLKKKSQRHRKQYFYGVIVKDRKFLDGTWVCLGLIILLQLKIFY